MDNVISTLKILLAESLDNVLVAGSFMFLIIAFFAAIAEPVAALLPLALSVALYGVAHFQDAD